MFLVWLYEKTCILKSFWKEKNVCYFFLYELQPNEVSDFNVSKTANDLVNSIIWECNYRQAPLFSKSYAKNYYQKFIVLYFLAEMHPYQRNHCCYLKALLKLKLLDKSWFQIYFKNDLYVLKVDFVYCAVTCISRIDWLGKRLVHTHPKVFNFFLRLARTHFMNLIHYWCFCHFLLTLGASHQFLYCDCERRYATIFLKLVKLQNFYVLECKIFTY